VQGIARSRIPFQGPGRRTTESIRKELVAQRENGTAVLLVSEELDELISVLTPSR
jgi:ABC-type uncharacterized transport system ATPase subunit